MTGKSPSPAVMTRLDYLLYGVVVLIWGSSWIALRMQLGTVAPEVSVLWRFAFALSFMLVWAIVKRERLSFPLAIHGRFAVLGALLFSSNFVLFYYGGLTTPSGLLAVIFSLASILNLMIGSALIRQWPSAKLALGGLIGAVGSGLMFAPQILGQEFGYSALIGLGFSILGTLCFCTGNVVAASLQRRNVSVLSSTVWGMAYGVMSLLLVIGIEGKRLTIEWTVPYWSALVFLAFFGSVVAFSCYLTLLGRIGAARAGYSTVLFPVIALGLSTLLEGYVWTLPAIAGLGLVVIGNFIVLRGPAKAA